MSSERPSMTVVLRDPQPTEPDVGATIDRIQTLYETKLERAWAQSHHFEELYEQEKKTAEMWKITNDLLKKQAEIYEAKIAKAKAVLETVAQEYGAAFHTSLRKCGDTDAEQALWQAIKDLPTEVWAAHLRTANDWLGVTDALKEL